jgi:hypothetical protein
MRTSLEPLYNFHRRFFAVLATNTDIDELVQALSRLDEPPAQAARRLKQDRGEAALAISDHYQRTGGNGSQALASAWLAIAVRSNDAARLILAAQLRRDLQLLPSFARMIGCKINRLLGEIGKPELATLGNSIGAARAMLAVADGATSVVAAPSIKPKASSATSDAATPYKHAVTVVAPGSIVTAIGDRDLKEGLKSFKILEEPVELRTAPADWQTSLAAFPWFADAIDRIARQIAAAPGQPVRLRPLLIHGLPGIGKTAFARALARAVGLPFRALSFAAQSDSRALLGTARGWGSANPSLVVEELRRSRCANPLIFIDEIEKAAHDSRNGDAQLALLNFLERENAAVFDDPFLQAPVDLSHVNWIAGANALAGLTPPLLSRFEVIEIKPPAEADWPQLQRSILAGIAGDLRLPPDAVPTLEPEVDAAMRKLLRRRRDLRVVRRALERVVHLQLASRTLN